MKSYSLKQAKKFRDDCFKQKKWSGYQFWRGYVGAVMDILTEHGWEPSEKELDDNFDNQPGIMKEKPE